MAEALLGALGPVLTRWTMGGSALSAAPAPWHDALGHDPAEAELRLLALSGQLLAALALPEPSGEVRALADIPQLALPPLPDPLRPRARRLLREMRDAGARRDLLHFLDARGYTLHPGDWMPRPGDDVPAVYAPWQDWASASGAETSTADVLSAESWDAFGPAARYAAFTALRRHAPAAAAALLAEKIGGENPEHRLRLVEALAPALSDADKPLLETLAADRAPRVKAQVAALLARLGDGGADAQDAAELAAFLPLQTKGLLRRTRVIVPQPLKTPAQRTRRQALFDTLSFDTLARTLGLSHADLVAVWPWGEDTGTDAALAAMAARSAPDAVVAAIAGAVTTGAAVDPYVLSPLLPLLPRLSPAHRREAALWVLRARGGSFYLAQGIAGADVAIDDAIRTPAGAALLDAVRAQDARPGDTAPDLHALGLLTTRAAARQALDQLTAAGLIASDPRLDMLRLSAALEDRRP